MDIEFECGHCGQSLIVEDEGAGMTIDCPKCGEPVEIPGVAPTATEERKREGKESAPRRVPMISVKPATGETYRLPPQRVRPPVEPARRDFAPQRVIVTDVQMPFSALASLMWKIVLAALPALIVLAAIVVAVWKLMTMLGLDEHLGGSPKP